ncbi:MAG: PAS domain-containing protein, partial [Planctomycetaceae bacterium]
MVKSSRLLVFGSVDGQFDPLIERLGEQHEVIVPDSLETALHQLRDDGFDGVLLVGAAIDSTASLLEAGGILEQLPDGVVVLGPDLRILGSNARMRDLAGTAKALSGSKFYDAFGTPEILGPDFCPLHTALGTGEPAKSTLRVGEASYFEVHAKPVFEDDSEIPACLVVIIRDVSTEILQRQKLNAIYQAGLELGDLSPLEILEM